MATSQLSPSCHSWDESRRCMGILHREVVSPCQVCLNHREWVETTIVRRAQSIFSPSVGDSASVSSLSRTYTTSQHSQRRAKKDPATPPASFLTSSCYTALSLFAFATLSFIISSQGFADAITFPPPLILSSGRLETPCDKTVASTFEIHKARGLFLTSKAVWLAASSAATGHPHSPLGKGIIQSDTAVCVFCGFLIVDGAIWFICSVFYLVIPRQKKKCIKF